MINSKEPMLPRLVMAITDIKTERKLSRILEQRHCSMYFQCFCMGTAGNELLNLCGLGESERILTMWIMPKEFVHKLFLEMDHTIHFKEKGGGIAVSLPMTGLPANLANFLKDHVMLELKKQMEQEEENMSNESVYSMILVTVNQGYSDDVIDTAKKAGASGGTIIRGRRRGIEEPMHFWGVSLQEELEILMIVAPKAKKSEIMSAVSREHGLHSPAQCLVMSMPVDEILGLEE